MASIPHDLESVSARPRCSTPVSWMLLCAVIAMGGAWWGGGKNVRPDREIPDRIVRIEEKRTGGDGPGVSEVPVRGGCAEVILPKGAGGGRVVIGVPSPEGHRIEVRLEPITESPSPRSQIVPLKLHPSERLTSLKSPRFQPPVRTEGEGPLPTERTFRFPRLSGLTHEGGIGLISGTLLDAGVWTAVYVDQRDRDLPHLPHLGREIVRLVDEELLGLIETRLWPIADLDGNGRMTLLLSSELIHISPSQQVATIPLKGMTWSEDYSASGRMGNEADLVYLHPHLQADAGLKSLLLHELAHAACFSRAFHAPGGETGRVPADWINEGIAHLAETWENSDRSNWGSRLQMFEQETGDGPLFVEAYSRAGLWRHPQSRGAVISFFQWLGRSRSEEFLREWFERESPDGAGLERFTGSSLEDLFREWSIETASGRGVKATHLKGEGENLIVLRGSTFVVVEIPAGFCGCRVVFPEGTVGQVSLLP